MDDSSKTLKAMGYAFGASLVASFAALLAGACVFGFELAQWTEWEGRVVGIIATISGIGGAIIGLSLAVPGDARQAK
jgi:hypothetical protein